MPPPRDQKPQLEQPTITREQIENLINTPPRRYRMMDWNNALRKASAPGRDPSLGFPFSETFQNIVRWCPVPTLGLREGTAREGKRGSSYTFLKCDESRLPERLYGQTP